MLDLLKNWVLNIAGVCILVVIIEMLIPSGKMKKYIMLISGFLILFSVIRPFADILNKGMEMTDYQTSSAISLDKKIVEDSGKIIKDSQMKQVVQIYRGKLLTHIEDLALEVKGVTKAKADVIINEDYKSEQFGELKRVYIYITEGEKTNAKKMVDKVDKINVGVGKADEKSILEVDGAVKSALENKISSVFSIAKNDIVISLQER